MTRDKHVGNFYTVELIRASVLRIFYHSARDTLVFVTFGVGQNTVNKSCDRINENARRDLAARKDEISYRDLLVYYLVDNSAVNTLVVSAKDYKSVVVRQLLCLPLIKYLARWRHKHDLG